MTNPKEWVEARQITEDFDAAEEIATWCHGRVVEEIHPLDGTKTPGINVPTLRGVRRASKDDYVIENVYEEYEVVNKLTYEENPITEDL
jgi:hypothetical protein